LKQAGKVNQRLGWVKLIGCQEWRLTFLSFSGNTKSTEEETQKAQNYP
jgi:hypothetical protein